MLIGFRNYIMWKEVFLGENVVSSKQPVQNLFAVCSVKPEMNEWGSWDWLSKLQRIWGSCSPVPKHSMAESSLLTPTQNYNVCSAVHAFGNRVWEWVEETGNRTADFQGHLAHGNLHSVILLLLPGVWKQSGISKPWHHLMRMNRLTQIPFLSDWIQPLEDRQISPNNVFFEWVKVFPGSEQLYT